MLERFGAAEPPLLVAILKPSLDPNLTIEGLESRLDAPLAGGFHAAKDDEMQGDFANLPLKARLDLAARRRGYIPAVNLDDPCEFRDVLARPELGMVLVNPTILGFPLLHWLQKVHPSAYSGPLVDAGHLRDMFQPSHLHATSPLVWV